MSATTVFLIIVIVAGGILVLGVFAVAFRRGADAGAMTSAELDTKAIAADRAARAARAEAAAGAGVATLERTEIGVEDESPSPEAAPSDEEPPPDPALERTDITATEYGVTRRQFFNRAVFAVFALFLAQFTIASLAFIWPKIRGGFGSPINAGPVPDLKESLGGAGVVTPVFLPAAQAWIVPFQLDEREGSSFEATPFVVAGGESDGVGLMALWQRCVHLGCRVPTCLPSQGFECPCHGSKYNIHGEYEAGPAPRNLDRFGVAVDDAGDFIIDTGTIVQTPRSKNKTAPYPQGPFCV